jgi:hypothetical protein
MKLQKLSLFGAVAGALMLTAAFAPRANAVLTTELLVYYNFNQDTVKTNVDAPQLSVSPGLLLNVPLQNSSNPSNTFPGGNLFVDPAVDAGLVNRAAGDVSLGTGALDARGNTTGGGLPNPAQPFCFVIGPFNNSGTIDGSISFALESTGGMKHGQFTTLTLSYSSDGTSFTSFHTFTTLSQYTSFTTLSATLPDAAHSSTEYIEFCFTGASNNDTNNNTYIDNIQITGEVPEPTTYIGGALGLLGLCWFQRRRFRSLRLRCT